MLILPPLLLTPVDCYPPPPLIFLVSPSLPFSPVQLTRPPHRTHLTNIGPPITRSLQVICRAESDSEATGGQPRDAPVPHALLEQGRAVR